MVQICRMHLTSKTKQQTQKNYWKINFCVVEKLLLRFVRKKAKYKSECRRVINNAILSQVHNFPFQLCNVRVFTWIFEIPQICSPSSGDEKIMPFLTDHYRIRQKLMHPWLRFAAHDKSVRLNDFFSVLALRTSCMHDLSSRMPI